jgi:hypothetical protein
MYSPNVCTPTFLLYLTNAAYLISSWSIIYEGESNENRKKIFKFNSLNESGTQLYHFST